VGDANLFGNLACRVFEKKNLINYFYVFKLFSYSNIKNKILKLKKYYLNIFLNKNYFKSNQRQIPNSLK
jgi:hypothetical protein